MVNVIVRMRGDVLFMLEKYPNNCLPKKRKLLFSAQRELDAMRQFVSDG